MKLDIVTTIIISALALFLIYREWRNLQDRITAQEKRIDMLEKSSRLRLPHQSFEELLDLMAALDLAEREAQFKVELIQNAKGHATNAMTVGTKREKS